MMTGSYYYHPPHTSLGYFIQRGQIPTTKIVICGRQVQNSLPISQTKIIWYSKPGMGDKAKVGKFKAPPPSLLSHTIARITQGIVLLPSVSGSNISLYNHRLVTDDKSDTTDIPKWTLANTAMNSTKVPNMSEDSHTMEELERNALLISESSISEKELIPKG